MNKFPSIRKNSDYQSVYRGGVSKAAGCLVMYIRKNELPGNRLGISVGKKVGNSIVRHTFARKIREIFRLNNVNVEQGYDIIVVARNRAKEADYHKLEYDYLKLLSYHNILKKENCAE